MRKLYLVPLLAAFVAVGCGDDNNPNQPSEITPTFQMNLLASNEVPPIVAPDPEATCAGTVTIRLNLTRDASNAITAGTVDFTANITGCPTSPSTTITAAHIHEGPAGQATGVVINTGINNTSVPLVNGAGGFTANGRTPTNQNDIGIFQRMLDNPSGFYFNIHSSAHTGGVIRAQLVRTQ
ncbi:MAG: CHRD domain-containing protein [Acidobacteriota bacterium]